jgi:ribosomal protein L18E
MPTTETNEYLLRREEESRQMAERASAPSVRKIHESLADRFAERVNADKDEVA